jgi:hypothetical protein
MLPGLNVFFNLSQHIFTFSQPDYKEKEITVSVAGDSRLWIRIGYGTFRMETNLDKIGKRLIPDNI